MGIREQVQRLTRRPGWTILAGTGVTTLAVAGFAVAGADDGPNDDLSGIQLRDTHTITTEVEATPEIVPIVPAPVITEINGSYDSPFDSPAGEYASASVASVTSADTSFDSPASAAS